VTTNPLSGAGKSLSLRESSASRGRAAAARRSVISAWRMAAASDSLSRRRYASPALRPAAAPAPYVLPTLLADVCSGGTASALPSALRPKRKAEAAACFLFAASLHSGRA